MSDPIAHMPVIATAGAYPGITAEVASPTSGAGVDVTVILASGYSPEQARVFAPFTRCSVGYLPSTTPMPGLDGLPGLTVSASAVLFEVDPDAHRALQENGELRALGLRVPTWVVVEGIDPASFVEYRDGVLDADTSGTILDGFRKATGVSTKTRADLEAAIMAGAYFLPAVVAGTPVARIPSGSWSSGDFRGTLRIRAFYSLQSASSTVAATWQDVLTPSSVLAAFDYIDSALEGHPVIDAALTHAKSTIANVAFHVAFDYFDPRPRGSGPGSKGEYRRADGMVIRLLDQDANVLATGTTDNTSPETASTGRVIWDSTGNNALPISMFPDTGPYVVAHVYLEIDVPLSRRILYQYGDPYATEQGWWGTWSTLRSSSSDNLFPGFIVSPGLVPRGEVGSAAAPIVFHIGIPFRFSLKFQGLKYVPPSAAELFGAYRTAPKGLRIDVATGIDGTTVQQSLYTDEDGEVHGSIFSRSSTANGLYVFLATEMFDQVVSLPTTVAKLYEWLPSASPPSVGTRSTFDTNFFDPNFSDSTMSGDWMIRTVAAAQGLQKVTFQSSWSTDNAITDYSAYVGGMLYVLKRIRDAHEFYHHITTGYDDWADLVRNKISRYEVRIYDKITEIPIKEFGSGAAADDVWVFQQTFGERTFSTADPAHEYTHFLFFVAAELTRAKIDTTSAFHYLGYFEPANNAYNANILSGHTPDRIIGPYTAFLEGISDFAELLFGGELSWTYVKGGSFDGFPALLDGEVELGPGGAPIAVSSYPSGAWGQGLQVALTQRNGGAWGSVYDTDAPGPYAFALYRFLSNTPPGSAGAAYDHPADAQYYSASDPAFATLDDDPLADGMSVSQAYPWVLDDAYKRIFAESFWLPLRALRDTTRWKTYAPTGGDEYPDLAAMLAYYESEIIPGSDPALGGLPVAADRRVRMRAWMLHMWVYWLT